MLVDAGSELAMLRNVDTNQPIEGFPQTPRDIAGLTGKDSLLFSNSTRVAKSLIQARLLIRSYARLEQTIEAELTQGGKGLECRLA